MSLNDFVAVHPVDRERVDAHKKRILTEVRAFQLGELCDRAVTQTENRRAPGSDGPIMMHRK